MEQTIAIGVIMVICACAAIGGDWHGRRMYRLGLAHGLSGVQHTFVCTLHGPFVLHIPAGEPLPADKPCPAEFLRKIETQPTSHRIERCNRASPRRKT